MSIVIIFTQEGSPRQTFTYSKSTIETLKKKCENYSKSTIKTPERLSNLFIVNFGHNLVCQDVVIRIGRFPVSEAVSLRMAQRACC